MNINKNYEKIYTAYLILLTTKKIITTISRKIIRSAKDGGIWEVKYGWIRVLSWIILEEKCLKGIYLRFSDEK